MPDATPSTLFTSESVTEGHPDKLCDAIADALLDDVLAHDTDARCAIEVATTTGLVLVLGELSTRHWVDVQDVVRPDREHALARVPRQSVNGPTAPGGRDARDVGAEVAENARRHLRGLTGQVEHAEAVEQAL